MKKIISMKKYFIILFFLTGFLMYPQQASWQQHADVTMHINMDVKNHAYEGTQILKYTNNSPDTLHELFYHLYWNAFRKESALYYHNHSLPDPDKRIERLASLKPEEEGGYEIYSLTQNGKPVTWEITETVMRVKLNKPILPGETHTFNMHYKTRIPILIRRSGRNNSEGVDYSMAQWYPRVAEYDADGWHADPFLGREFYGVWGNFDVYITIERKYTVAATGYLQNPKEIGKGYLPKGEKPLKKFRRAKKLTWHFKAPNVHDFSWAADTDYVHTVTEGPNGVKLHFFYIPSDSTVVKNWSQLPEYTAKAMEYYNKNIGNYPYKKYSVIQAGDGGMEYGMCTFITGKRPLMSLVGVTMHELAHSWFQFVLATDETRHPWMDEGFTTFISTAAMNELTGQNKTPHPFIDDVENIIGYLSSGKAEPASVWSDFYTTQQSYWMNAYSKGSLFLVHMVNIAGWDKTIDFLRAYYNQWKFKHPQPKDMLRTAEKATGMQLNWFYNHWIESTHAVDYAIDTVIAKGQKTQIKIRKKGSMYVPLDVAVILKNGERILIHIPYFRTLKYRRTLAFNGEVSVETLKPWYDGFPVYSFEVPVKKEDIKIVLADYFFLTSDLNYNDNLWPKPSEEK